jgi:23S rRNA (cytidine1920-2'-O)/16S rRNA (cytidine1409-2'-O)-methyltransferase
MKVSKIRLDVALSTLGLANTRSQATGLIMAGQVLINNQLATKAGILVNLVTDDIRLKAGYCPYVSRGGLKLAGALHQFKLTATNATCLDVGASTGGFTDCLLQQGAAHVYAVDVGQGQLDPKLLQDARVHNMEKCNARYLSPSLFEDNPPSIGVTDVSFISLKKILPPLLSCLTLTPESWCVALLKPQFECLDYFTPQEAKAFDGVIKDTALREKVTSGTLADLATLVPAPWQLQAIAPSPIVGAKGNQEFLTLWRYMPIND